MGGSERVAALIKKAIIDRIEQAGYEVVRLQMPPTRHLRVMIDVPDGAVTLADCRTVSRVVEQALDEVGHDPGSFAIEVESPGVDRPLTRPRDFERFKGERITLTLNAARQPDGRRRFTGTLLGFDGGDVTMHVLDAKAPETFKRADIKGVRLNPEPIKNDDGYRPKRRGSGRLKRGGTRRKSGRQRRSG